MRAILFILLIPSVLFGQEVGDKVSFSTDIAPLLAKRCVVCHGERRARAELRLDTFSGLTEGSENGEIVETIDAESSLIVLKMKGEADGDRMPPQGSPISDEMIAKFEAWIAAGAKFDGSDRSMTLDALMRATRRANLSEGELNKAAEDAARKKWDLAFPGAKISVTRTENWIVVTDKKTAAGLERASKQLDAVVEKSLKALGLPKGTTLKGGLTLFVVAKQYDFSEWMQMVEKQSNGTDRMLWDNGEGFGYVVLGPKTLNKKGLIEDEARFSEMAVAALLSRWGSPRWYAEGQSRRIRSVVNRRDMAAKTWKTTAINVIPKVKKSKTIFDAELPESQADAASWAFATYLGSDKRRVNLLHNNLREGEAFEKAFVASYGAKPEDVCDRWLMSFQPKDKRRKYKKK